MKKIILGLSMAFLSCLSSFAQYPKEIIVEPLLKTDTTAMGQKIVYPSFVNDEVTICKVTIHPGKSTGWHKHLIPVFAFVQQGTLTVQLENGKTNSFPTNTTFAEVINLYHNGTNLGKEDVVLIAFYLGGKGEALSIKKE
jgi:quercetin dioxygenase-like cupin family protein